MMHPVVAAWLADAGTWIALALLGACLAYSIALLVFPRAALAFSARVNRHYSGAAALRLLETPRLTERFFYRHHRMVGGLLLAGVCAFFLLFFFGYPADTVLQAIAAKTGRALAGALIDTVEGFLLGANLLIGIFAAVMIVRPSLLKPLEARANRWITIRHALGEAETPRVPMDDFLVRHPRIGGLLVLFGTLYTGISFVVAMR